MKQFIRYLYEYQQGQRMRNVGFVKVEQDEKNTVVHIHGKGLRLADDKTLKIYIFYIQQKECIGVWQGDIEHVNPSVNYRLMYTPEDAGQPENYSQIAGIILENAGKRCFAAVWTDMPVDVEHMRIWQEMPDVQDESTKFQEEHRNAYEAMEDVELVEEAAEDTEPDMIQVILPEIEPEEDVEIASEYEPMDERQPMEMEKNTQSKPLLPQYYKIQRQDIAKLPRCEWRLANNSFLMHGCYNYHHLLLIQQENGWWLGVPGVYHCREARAAESFGFPRFLRVDDDILQLSEEERNQEDDFGYWCRQVRR